MARVAVLLLLAVLVSGASPGLAVEPPSGGCGNFGPGLYMTFGSSVELAAPLPLPPWQYSAQLWLQLDGSTARLIISMGGVEVEVSAGGVLAVYWRGQSPPVALTYGHIVTPLTPHLVEWGADTVDAATGVARLYLRLDGADISGGYVPVSTLPPLTTLSVSQVGNDAARILPLRIWAARPVPKWQFEEPSDSEPSLVVNLLDATSLPVATASVPLCWESSERVIMTDGFESGDVSRWRSHP